MAESFYLDDSRHDENMSKVSFLFFLTSIASWCWLPYCSFGLLEKNGWVILYYTLSMFAYWKTSVILNFEKKNISIEMFLDKYWNFFFFTWGGIPVADFISNSLFLLFKSQDKVQA